jgi:hypothetical protein
VDVSPGSINVEVGGSGTATATISRTGGFNAAVSLTASGAPAGMTVSFNPQSVPAATTTSTVDVGVANTVAPGTYTVQETLDPNDVYDLTDISCTASAGSSGTPTLATGLSTIVLANNGAVTCTYTNTKLGSLTIIKDTVPDDGTDFVYTTSANLTGFSLDDDANATLSNTKAFNNLSNGVLRTVTETTNPNYALSNIVCTGQTGSTVAIGTDADTAFNAGDAQVSVTLANGEDVTCTYTNTLQLGAIKITKTSTKGSTGLDGVEFSITRDGNAIAGSPFTTANGGIVCVESLNFADYVVTETDAPDGWLINDTTGHTITVDNNAKCSDDPFVGETIAFSDTPLSSFQILFTSLAGPGVTRANISCDVPAVEENGAPDTLTITDISVAAQTVITTSTSHGLTSGDKVNIAGSNSDPSVNGLHTVTVLTPTTFRIPVEVIDGGDAGTVTPYDDTDETFGNGETGLVPGKYTCTIDIDP